MLARLCQFVNIKGMITGFQPLRHNRFMGRFSLVDDHRIGSFTLECSRREKPAENESTTCGFFWNRHSLQEPIHLICPTSNQNNSHPNCGRKLYGRPSNGFTDVAFTCWRMYVVIRRPSASVPVQRYKFSHSGCGGLQKDSA